MKSKSAVTCCGQGTYIETEKENGSGVAKRLAETVRISDFNREHMKKKAAGLLGSANLAILVGLVCVAAVSHAVGQVMVWGDNTYGQTNVPASATNVIALAAGDSHCLALKADGTVVTWGRNYLGLTDVPSDLTNAVAIAAGSTHSLVLRSDGTVILLGKIYYGTTNVPSEVTNVVALGLGPGAQHAVVLRADGTVVDWGNPWYSHTNIPPTATNIVSVAAGAYHSLALRADGKVVAWGDNSCGQGSVPASATNIVAIATGWYGNAALRADGTILVWGYVSSPPSLSGFTNIIDVACPFNSVYANCSILALKRNGTMVEYTQSLPVYPTNQIAAIGAGSYNGLALVGSGPPTFPGLPVNRTVNAGTTAYLRMVAVGALPLFYQWSCNGTNIPGATNTVLVLTNVQPAQAGSQYWLTASNSFGMATSGPIILNVTPSEVHIQASTLSAVVGETVTFTGTVIGQGPFSYQWQFYGTNLPGATNSILTLTNAQLWDAGLYSLLVSNNFGVVTGFVSLTVVPTIITKPLTSQVIFLGGTAQLSIGLKAVIPVTYQWLFNDTRLEGATNNSLTLTNVQYDQAGTYTVIFSDAFETVTNSAMLSVVPVAAWGRNSHGQLNVPAGLTNVMAAAAGSGGSLALKTDGTIVGWGADTKLTKPPADLTNAIAISVGGSHGLALRTDGCVMAWGLNNEGQTNVPPNLTNVVAISCGNEHNLVLKSDGTIFAWGSNSSGQTNIPPGLTNVVAIAAGSSHCLALRSDGTVVAWGYNGNGQTNVPSCLSNVVAIAAGEIHSVALKGDGTVVVWGSTNYGLQKIPAAATNVVAIAAGYAHCLALKADGSVLAWGYYSDGETNIPTGLKNVKAIAAGDFHNLALIGDGLPILHALLTNPTLGADGFSVSLPSESGRVYRLEYKNSLSDGDWTALPLAAGNGRVLTLTDPTATGAQRFYRVRRW